MLDVPEVVLEAVDVEELPPAVVETVRCKDVLMPDAELSETVRVDEVLMLDAELPEVVVANEELDL